MTQRTLEVNTKGAWKTWSYTLLTVLSAQRETKRTVESFQPVFDSTGLQRDSYQAQKGDVIALFFFAPATQYNPLLPNWIWFNMFGGFCQCIFSKSVMYCMFPGWEHLQIKSSLWPVFCCWIKFRDINSLFKIIRKHFPRTGLFSVFICECDTFWFPQG